MKARRQVISKDDDSSEEEDASSSGASSEQDASRGGESYVEWTIRATRIAEELATKMKVSDWVKTRW